MTRTIFHIDSTGITTNGGASASGITNGRPSVQGIIVQAEKIGLKTRVLSEWAVEVICDDDHDNVKDGRSGADRGEDDNLCQERLARIYANHPSVAIFYDHSHPRNGKLIKHHTHFRRLTDGTKDSRDVKDSRDSKFEKTMPRSAAPLVTVIPGLNAQFGQTTSFLSKFYDFPSRLASASTAPSPLNGRPTIAILSLGGTYLKTDCDAYWKILGFTGDQVPIIKNIVVSTNSSLSCDALVKDLQKTTVGGKNANNTVRTIESIWDDWTGSSGVNAVSGINARFPAFTSSSADMETTLDVQIAGGMCPGCNLWVYSVPNTSLGLYQGIYRIIKDLKALKAANTNSAANTGIRSPVGAADCGRAFSISWGASESDYSVTEMHCIDSMFADAKQNGIVTCAASGDDGSTDGVDDQLLHVDFPAISPNVISCGGSSLVGVSVTTAASLSSGTGSIGANVEKAWTWTNRTRSGGGGGFSTVFKRPAYQAGLAVPYPLPLSTLPSSIPITMDSRMSPDLSLNADSRSGWTIYFNGQLEISSYGGTSCVAPAMAGYFAGLNLPLEIVANLHEILYAIAKNPLTPGCFRDITVGSNDSTERPGVSPLIVSTTTHALCFNTMKGYDLCTGLGVPDGTKLAAAIMAYASQSSIPIVAAPIRTSNVVTSTKTVPAISITAPPSSIVPIIKTATAPITVGTVMPVAMPKFDPGAARIRAITAAAAVVPAVVIQPPAVGKKISFLGRVMGKGKKEDQ